MDDRQLLSLCGDLYDGVTNDAIWVEALSRVMKIIDAIHFHQVRVDSETKKVISGIADHEANRSSVTLYECHYSTLDIRMNIFASLAGGEFKFDHEYFPKKVIDSSPIYSEWLKSVGMRHTAIVNLDEGEGFVNHLGFMRNYDQKEFSKEDKNFLRLMVPHIYKASHLRSSFEELAKNFVGRTGFDFQSEVKAFIIFREDFSIVEISNKAKAIIDDAIGLSISKNRLVFSNGSLQSCFENAVKLALHNSNPCGHEMEIPLSTCLGRVAIVPISPKNADRSSLTYGRTAVMYWIEQSLANRSNIRDVYKLTKAEWMLLSSTINGEGLVEYSNRVGISWHTARTHMKNLMRKMGCRKQAEVIKIAMSYSRLNGM